MGLLARIGIDRVKTPRMSRLSDFLRRDRPTWKGTKIDFYYWHFATYALFQYDGPSGPRWRSWNFPMKEAVVKNQNPPSAGCKAGSWEPVGRWCSEGGRVYATALNAMTLQVYYRFPFIFGLK